MTTKQINITVPFNWCIPEILNTLNAEENACILTIGSEMIKEARNLVAGLTQKDIYQKIKNESKIEIQQLEVDLLVQKKLNSEIDSSMRNFYEKQVEQMKKQIIDLNRQLTDHVNNSKYIIQEEVDKEKDKFKNLLEDKNKQVLRITENYEKYLQQTTTKSSKKLGDEGEDNFMLLSDTFKDFVGYKIEKKSHQGHKGDFHLFFENFNVLVDLKNYTGSVQKKELEKIENDLSINDTMDFGWLISYESNVSDWNRFPIMCKWIVTDIGLKCIIIVNKLNLSKSPIDMLRIVWNLTNEIHTILNKTKELDNSELIKMKERDYNVLQKIKMAQKRLSEMKRNVVSMSQITKDIENDIIDAISMFTNELSKNEFDKRFKIKEWWNDNIDFDEKDTNSKITSTDIWSRFKKENKIYIDKNKILIDDFKKYIKDFVDTNNYIEKSKKGTIEFIGFKFKDLLVSELNSESTINVEIDIPKVETIKKKKRILKKSGKVMIDEDTDNAIINSYMDVNNNILDIAETSKVLVWQVVSVLIKNGLISTRSDARGYDLYKETEYYKSKIETK